LFCDGSRRSVVHLPKQVPRTRVAFCYLCGQPLRSSSNPTQDFFSSAMIPVWSSVGRASITPAKVARSCRAACNWSMSEITMPKPVSSRSRSWDRSHKSSSRARSMRRKTYRRLPLWPDEVAFDKADKLASRQPGHGRDDIVFGVTVCHFPAPFIRSARGS
jgi:hypothetical protein